MDKASAIPLILTAIREYNEQVPPNRRIPESPDVTLFGSNGHLDSLGLVNLILTVEEHIKDQYQVGLSLADERAMSQERNPFQNVQSLSAYIVRLLNEAHDS